jgi:hypothetical protein
MAKGNGAYKVALLFADEAERDHWMLNQLCKRASLPDHVVEKDNFLLLTVAENSFNTLVHNGIKIVVPMGEAALFDVLRTYDIFRWFGRMVPHPDLQQFGVWVAPLFAPSALLPAHGNAEDDEDDSPLFKKRVLRHPPRYQGTQVAFLRRILRWAKEPPTPLVRDYTFDPSPGKFAAWADDFYVNHEGVLSWDIETPYKKKATNEEEQAEAELKADATILRISFAYKPGVAVSVPWSAEYLPTIKRLLAFAGIHVGWNIRAFDVPHITANSILIGGPVHDGMDAFHFWQSDLDRGLEAVSAICAPDQEPWKHLSQAQEYEALYSCIDSDIGLRNYLDIRTRLQEQGAWEAWVHQNDDVMPPLEAAGKNGVHIDIPAQNKLGEILELKEWELLVAAQDLVDTRFLRKKVLVRKPKNPKGDWQEQAIEKSVKFCGHCGQNNINVRHNCQAIKDGKGQDVQKKTVIISGWYCESPLDQARGCSTKEFKKWLAGNGFNPNSTQQMMAYMKFYGHPVGVNFKTKNDSADTKHLHTLRKKYGHDHPIYAHCIELHKVTKAKSTYVEGLRPDHTGRVYTTYTNTPSTWRLSSRNVNMQNQGKRESNPYAKAARKTIIAPKGFVFVQADSSAIEAVFTGYFMGDPEYVALARDGVHDFLTCKWLGIPWDPANLDAIKKTPGYKEQREKMKRVVHGTNYGMGPYLMHMNEPEVFPSLKSARDAQDFYFKVLPKLPEFQYETRMRVKKEGFLTNPWKLRHYFYDVFTYELDENREIIINPKTGKPKVKLGKDAKRVVAFKPQSSAGFFARDNIAIIDKKVHRSWLPANLTVHDGYCLVVPDHTADVEGATEVLTGTLTRGIPEMEGLQVGCEVETGYNWGDMTKTLTVKV